MTLRQLKPAIRPHHVNQLQRSAPEYTPLSSSLSIILDSGTLRATEQASSNGSISRGRVDHLSSASKTSCSSRRASFADPPIGGIDRRRNRAHNISYAKVTLFEHLKAFRQVLCSTAKPIASSYFRCQLTRRPWDTHSSEIGADLFKLGAEFCLNRAVFRGAEFSRPNPALRAGLTPLSNYIWTKNPLRTFARLW
jgi:hypothetical protein